MLDRRSFLKALGIAPAAAIAAKFLPAETAVATVKDSLTADAPGQLPNQETQGFSLWINGQEYEPRAIELVPRSHIDVTSFDMEYRSYMEDAMREVSLEVSGYHDLSATPLLNCQLRAPGVSFSFKGKLRGSDFCLRGPNECRTWLHIEMVGPAKFDSAS